MTVAEILKLLLLLSIVLNVLALALQAKAGDALFLFRDWRLGLRAFTAMFIVVPAVAIGIALAFELKPAVEIALVALAFSPVPPLLPKKQIKAGGSASYVTGLLVAASLVSLVVTPVGLHFAARLFGVDADVAPVTIARILGIGVAAPLIIGILGGRMLGDRAAGIAGIVAKVGGLLFLLCIVALLVKLAPAIWAVIGDGTIAALIAMIVAGLAAGYWLAGDAPEHKVVLSLATAARHPGIAIAIATANFPDAKLAPAAIVLAALLNALISIPYLKQLGKRRS